MEALLVEQLLERAGVGVGDKMNDMPCPLCHKNVYSELGKGCKMCGMVLEDDGEFCSDLCESHFLEIGVRRGVRN